MYIALKTKQIDHLLVIAFQEMPPKHPLKLKRSAIISIQSNRGGQISAEQRARSVKLKLLEKMHMHMIEKDGANFNDPCMLDVLSPTPPPLSWLYIAPLLLAIAI